MQPRGMRKAWRDDIKRRRKKGSKMNNDHDQSYADYIEDQQECDTVEVAKRPARRGVYSTDTTFGGFGQDKMLDGCMACWALEGELHRPHCEFSVETEARLQHVITYAHSLNNSANAEIHHIARQFMNGLGNIDMFAGFGVFIDPLYVWEGMIMDLPINHPIIEKFGVTL